MDAFEALKKRRSVRRFLPDPVSRAVIEEILDAARYAPSADNTQPWEFVVITRRQTLEELASHIPNAPFLGNAPAAVAVFCRQSEHFVEGGAAAVQSILIAATAKGLGSCWIPALDMPYEKQIARLLRARGHHRLLALVAIGYGAEETNLRPAKRLLEDMLHWESF